jgi:hypothetical protein
MDLTSTAPVTKLLFVVGEWWLRWHGIRVELLAEHEVAVIQQPRPMAPQVRRDVQTQTSHSAHAALPPHWGT